MENTKSKGKSPDREKALLFLAYIDIIIILLGILTLALLF